MKKLLTILAMFISMCLAQTASALTIEVAPLKLQARAEVLGFEMGVDGQKIIVVTGKVAADLARFGNFVFDETTQMLILTGKEVTRYLNKSLKELKKAGKAVGKAAIVATSDIIDFVYKLGKDVVLLGKAVVKTSYKVTKKITKKVYKHLKKIAKKPVIILKDTGIFVFKTGFSVVGHVINLGCRLIDLIPGINLGCKS